MGEELNFGWTRGVLQVLWGELAVVLFGDARVGEFVRRGGIGDLPMQRTKRFGIGSEFIHESRG